LAGKRELKAQQSIEWRILWMQCVEARGMINDMGLFTEIDAVIEFSATFTSGQR